MSDRYHQRNGERILLGIDGNERGQRLMSMKVKGKNVGKGEKKGGLLADTPVSTLRIIPVGQGNTVFSLVCCYQPAPLPTMYFYRNRGPPQYY